MNQSRSFFSKVKSAAVGNPLSLDSESLFHRLALIPLLAWVGLGADGLSSSAYGPAEAFLAIGQHRYLAILLAAVTALTVFVIAAAYSKIIEEFPSGGGGYLVASKLLGPSAGVVSGSALMVDYVLTIAVSISAAGDAIFSLFPSALHLKFTFEMLLIFILVMLNLRGVKESVMALLPIFILFLFTHALLMGGAFFHGSNGNGAVPARALVTDFKNDFSSLGFLGLFLIFSRAYSLGGGTYTGIEAVSNGLSIMREPRVPSAKRTMLYMALSLSITAAGLFIAYLIMGTSPIEGKTLNAVLSEQVFHGWPFSSVLIFLTLLSEGTLLIVGAQAGFLDGPRVLANMALDGWMPRRFSSLSGRLTNQDGILLVGGAALLAVIFTGGKVDKLVVMYSINVFLTFSLSMIGMLKSKMSRWSQAKRKSFSDILIFASGAVLCLSILCITIVEKFTVGGWLTVAITSVVVLCAFGIKRHYQNVAKRISKLHNHLLTESPKSELMPRDFDPSEPTAIVLVSGFHGIGVQLCKAIFDSFPGAFKNVCFVSGGIIDSGAYKGVDEIENLKNSVSESLRKYASTAQMLGYPARVFQGIGTDPEDLLEELCVNASRDLKKPVFFSGQLVFEQEMWFHRILHNQTAFSLQKRLHRHGLTLVVMPIQEEHSFASVT